MICVKLHQRQVTLHTTKIDIINLYLVVQWTLVKIEGYNNCSVMIKRKCIIVHVNI